jgi:hypothetical protein
MQLEFLVFVTSKKAAILRLLSKFTTHNALGQLLQLLPLQCIT